MVVRGRQGQNKLPIRIFMANEKAIPIGHIWRRFFSFVTLKTDFSNSLVIHDEKTKEITSVKEVWKCDLNYRSTW